MRRTVQVRPMRQVNLSEPATDPAGLPEEPTRLSPERDSHRSEKKHHGKSILSRLLASRHSHRHKSQDRRIESEVATAVFEDSFDPTSVQVPSQHASLSGQKGLELPSLKTRMGTVHSQERRARRESTHTRGSSVDSMEPFANELVIKSQEWAAEATQQSDPNTDRLKGFIHPPLESSSRLLSPAPPGAAYSIQQVASSSKARQELLSLNPALYIVSMAVTTPEKYPLLDLSEQGLEDSDIWKIVRLTEVYPFANGLDLYGNQLVIGKKAVVPVGVQHREIKKLSLRRCHLGRAGDESQLGAFIRVFVALERLDLRGCGLKDEDMSRIGADLSSLSKLKVLLLSENPLSNLGVYSLIPVLERCPVLSLVDLCQTKVSSGVKKALGEHKDKVVLQEGRKCCSRCSLF